MKIKSSPERRAARSYGQYCALARSLDHIGDRWTLLIVRELLVGPRRYSDIRAGLPGIASNLLAERLRELEADGIIQKRNVPPPTPATLYELTEFGAGLQEVVFALARWGGRWMMERGDDVFDPKWLVVALAALFQAAPGDLSLDVEFVVEGEPVHARVTGGKTVVGLGRAEDPDLSIECDARTVLGICAGMIPLEDAAATESAVIRGPARARKDFSRLVSSG